MSTILPMPEPVVTTLRDVIEATVFSTTAEDLPQPVQDLLADHLKALLEQERKLLFITAVKLEGPVEYPVAGEKPWYPDDSGEWVERDDADVAQPAGLSDSTRVDTLWAGEREQMVHDGEPDAAVLWAWDVAAGHRDRIVAYKVVKP